MKSKEGGAANTAVRDLDEIAKNQIENTKEFQKQFADRVDPFGKNKKKDTIKMSKIKFTAPDSSEQKNLGSMKQAELPEAQISRGERKEKR